MNLSHVITDFSFGPYFPQMTQPLTNTLEIAQDRKFCLLPGLPAYLTSRWCIVFSFRGISILPERSPYYLQSATGEACIDEPVQCDALHPCLNA